MRWVSHLLIQASRPDSLWRGLARDTGHEDREVPSNLQFIARSDFDRAKTGVRLSPPPVNGGAGLQLFPL